MEDLIVKYEKMYKDYLKGKITDDEWSDYCIGTLFELMEINREVSEMLKDISH